MARQRKLTKERKELINQLLTTYQPEDAGDPVSVSDSNDSCHHCRECREKRVKIK